MLKGTTRIELTNVNTGEVEVIVKHNLVTNAIPDLLQLNPDGYLFDGSYKLSNDLLPICPNAIGGILLYGEPLEENPAKYYAPESNPLIGYSSNNVNESADPMRGSLNLNESGILDGNKGYRFVFDFTTSQANGTIASLGLTSKYAGIAGYGSMYDASNQVILLSSKAEKLTANNAAALKAVANIVSIDWSNGIAYYAYVSEAKTIQVGKIRIGKLWLNTDTGPETRNVLDAKTLTTKAFAPSITNKYSYTALVDGGDGYIWGFGHANNAKGNSSGASSILWIKISKADFSFTEGTWSIDKRFNYFGKTLVGSAYNSNECNTNCIIFKGCLYCVDYWESSIIKINLNNPSDLEYINDPDAATPVVGGAYACEFNVNGDVLFFPGGYRSAGKFYGSIAPTDGMYTGLYGMAKPHLHCEPYLFGYRASAGHVYREVYLMTPYLATINNLETPVTKTADKTMKITYILREE